MANLSAPAERLSAQRGRNQNPESLDPLKEVWSQSRSKAAIPGRLFLCCHRDRCGDHGTGLASGDATEPPARPEAGRLGHNDARIETVPAHRLRSSP